MSYARPRLNFKARWGKKGKKPTLYNSPEGKICYGHKSGFEPWDPRTPVPGCVRCEAKLKVVET